jgi:hypothetical protein
VKKLCSVRSFISHLDLRYRVGRGVMSDVPSRVTKLISFNII